MKIKISNKLKVTDCPVHMAKEIKERLTFANPKYLENLRKYRLLEFRNILFSAYLNLYPNLGHVHRTPHITFIPLSFVYPFNPAHLSLFVSKMLFLLSRLSFLSFRRNSLML